MFRVGQSQSTHAKGMLVLLEMLIKGVKRQQADREMKGGRKTWAKL